MKELLLIVLALLVGLIVLGGIIQGLKTPEQKAADSALAKESAKQRAANEAEEQAHKALKKLVDPARDTLELAYIQHVKDESATHISCAEAEFSNRFFIRCGVGYGSPETANNGLWEAAEDKGNLVLFAMNGKALRALEKIGESTEFQPGHSRPSVDTVALSEKFK